MLLVGKMRANNIKNLIIIELTTSGLDLPLLCRLSYEVKSRTPVSMYQFGPI